MRARVITYFDIHIHIDYMMCLVYKLYVPYLILDIDYFMISILIIIYTL